MSILFTAVFSGLEVIWDRQFGFLKETLVAPISRTEIMIGKTLGGAAIAMIQGLIVLSLTYVLGFRIPSLSSLGLGLIFMFLIAIFFTGLGLTIASKMTDLHGFQLIMNFLIMPIFFLSGALFPLENLPPAIYFISRIDPLTYGVDGLRGAITGMSTFRRLQRSGSNRCIVRPCLRNRDSAFFEDRGVKVQISFLRIRVIKTRNYFLEKKSIFLHEFTVCSNC